MRNHLVSHCLCFLSLLLACSTHMVFYIWVCILRFFFHIPLALFSGFNFFFFKCSECLYSEQKWTSEEEWMEKSCCHLDTFSSVAVGPVFSAHW